MIDIAENNWYWVTATILAVLIGGGWFYLAPTEKYDVCRDGNSYGEWYNITETVYVDDRLSAVGKYRCDIEDKELWCGRTTTTRCYYILEEGLIPQDLSRHGISWDRTDYSRNRTNMILYSGVRNVFEGGKWVRIENSTGSIKRYFNVEYIKKNSTLNMTVLDFGYKWIELEFGIGDTGLLRKMIPVKLDGKEIKRFLWNSISDKRFYRIELNNTLGHIYGFGKNSTSVILQDANTENLDDAWIHGGSTDRKEERGACDYHRNSVAVGTEQMAFFIKYNITQIPSGQTIDNATACNYLEDNRLDAGESMTVSTHHVYSFPDYNITNQEWTEGDSGCAGAASDAGEMDFDNKSTTSSQYNTTAEESLVIATGAGTNKFYCWQAHDMVDTEYGEGDDNITIYFRTTPGSGSPNALDYLRWSSKEDGTSARRPYLNITYSAPSVEPCWNLDDGYVPPGCDYFTITGDYVI